MGSVYTLQGGVNNPDEAVSINEDKNIIAVGKRLQKELIKREIGTSQSKANVTEELNKKNWNYNHTYELSRGLVQQEALVTEKSINYLIDIHRDSQPKEIATSIINGKPYARVSFVVGKKIKIMNKFTPCKRITSKFRRKIPWNK